MTESYRIYFGEPQTELKHIFSPYRVCPIGALSNASCESSIHNYECGSPELIAIYRALRETDEVYGGRFSEAGVKGACIALVDPEKKESIERTATENIWLSSHNTRIRSRCSSSEVMRELVLFFDKNIESIVKS